MKHKRNSKSIQHIKEKRQQTELSDYIEAKELPKWAEDFDKLANKYEK